MAFLYGAVVGLAIREALVRVGPGLVNFLSSTMQPWKMRLEAARLGIFFLAISTFYVGSVQFFDKVHVREGAEGSYPRTVYAFDFWIGLIHFVLFFFCAITIDDFLRIKPGISLFVMYLAFIFLYDILWLCVNWGQDSFEEIKVWTWSSALTVFLAGVAFLVTKFVLSQDDVIAEYASLSIFGAYLFIDLSELLTGNPIISRWLLRLLPRSAVVAQPTSTAQAPGQIHDK